MAIHEFRIDPGSLVGQVVLSPYEGWAQEAHGGLWARTPNPNEPATGDDTIAHRNYAAIGHRVDFGLRELTIPDPPVWDSASATVQQQDDDGVWYWLWDRARGPVAEFCRHPWQGGDLIVWRNTMPPGTPNVWPPGVAGWRPHRSHPSGWSHWSQPSGAHDSYPLAFIVAHDDRYAESMVADNVWEPFAPGIGANIWREVDVNGTPL